MRKKYSEALLAQIAQHNEALNAQIDANRKDRELARERLDFERQQHHDSLKVKDRVDISLRTYEAMKSRIDELEKKVDLQDQMLRTMHVDRQIIDDIRVESIKVKTGFDIYRNENMMQIEFNYKYRP